MKSGPDAHRLILRGGASAALGYVVRFGARLLFLFLAARLFGAALFGAYSLAIAAVELAVAVGGLGMKRFLFKLLEERPAERPAAHVVIDAALLVAGASLIVAAAVMLVMLLVPQGFIAENSRIGILIVAPMIAGQALIDLFLAATRWKHRMRYEVAARSIVEPYAGIAALGVAYAAGFAETGLLISYWAGTLAALAYAVAGTRRCYGTFGLLHYRAVPRDLVRIFRASAFPTSSDFINGLFARLDLYLVGIFLGEAPAGIYGMARQVRTPVRQVRQSFDGLLTPILARTLAAHGPVHTGTAAASASRLILALQLPILVSLIALGLPLLQWFGPEFAAGYAALLILAAAETIHGAFGVSDLILLYRRPALSLAVTSACIAVNLVVAWLLIDRYGLDGAAWAVLIAALAGALVRRAMLRASFGISIPVAYSAGPAVAAIGAAAAALAAARLLDSSSPLLACAASLAAGLAAYAILLKLWLRARGESLSLMNLETNSGML